MSEHDRASEWISGNTISDRLSSFENHSISMQIFLRCLSSEIFRVSVYPASVATPTGLFGGYLDNSSMSSFTVKDLCSDVFSVFLMLYSLDHIRFILFFFLSQPHSARFVHLRRTCTGYADRLALSCTVSGKPTRQGARAPLSVGSVKILVVFMRDEQFQSFF